MKLQKLFKMLKVCILSLACSTFLFDCEHAIRTEEKMIGQEVGEESKKVYDERLILHY
ncbi:hypothetical protein [Bacillus wiedmannii]|uniref:hypothetical protein n=1 Tax=Bacillus wiedmannii TaxID=1890302 RepID=UPI000B1B2416|nr:hypothetical protein [Bacillus wiedmannii]MBZ4220879.1 hypothetical protein [Bacillus wiedmannii]